MNSLVKGFMVIGVSVTAKAAMRLLTLLLVAVFAVLSSSVSFADDERVKVVASFSILADIAEQVGGERVEVTSIVGVNGDTHVYRARPMDAKQITYADLLVINGLGFEGWIERLESSARFNGIKVVATDDIRLLRDNRERSVQVMPMGHIHQHGTIDPHAWHSLQNGMQYAKAIAQGLMTADPEHQDYYQQRLDDFLVRAEQLDQELHALVAQLPPERLRVITSHDAFAYLAVDYGFQFISVQGVSTESEVAAGDLSRLIREVRNTEAAAIFLENISDPRLMNQVAKETGASIGGTLYSGSLSEADGPAASYLELMRHNVTTLVAALSAP